MSDKSLADRLEAARHMRSDPREMDALIEGVRELERDKAGAEYNEGLVIAELAELEKERQQSNVCIDGDCGRVAAHCEEHFTLAWDHNEYIEEKRVAALEGILREAPESPSRYRKGAEGAWLDYARQSAEWLMRARGVLGETNGDV